MTVLKVIYYLLASLVFSVIIATILTMLFGNLIIDMGQGIADFYSYIKEFKRTNKLTFHIITFVISIFLIIIGLKMLFKSRHY
ncbi:hypothetical protein HMPREF2821_00690 [Staphylococcus sp. HMSC065C10]|uniref:hypothetical protein n=1 Tax=Staphylococcus TaxID=1279 RepID=UPI0008A1E96C|nr:MULTISPECIES: hypothetical protein [Staphylococcus]OFK29000.1 hypothetical protein HMPREF2821_00690 [Staphylococcus sp. HMSC065C10]